MDLELERLNTKVTRSIQDLDGRQTQQAPDGELDQWNIQQIIEHLLLYFRSTSAAAELRLAKRRPTRAMPTLIQHIGQFTVLTMRYLPSGSDCAPELQPQQLVRLRSGLELADLFGAELARMDRVLTRVETAFGDNRSVTHRTLGPLSPKQWRRFHVVHGYHHLRQIAAIRNA